METVDTLVVGAGVVGIAVARELVILGSDVIVAEKETMAGQGISARNSGVVHAGLYYPNDSLKARFCVEGRSLLNMYCQNYDVPYNQIGKYVVATTAEEVQSLLTLKENAIRNGVDGLKLISRERMHELEPELDVQAAMFSPSTGIVDVPELILSMIGQLEEAGGAVAFKTTVKRITPADNGFIVELVDSRPYSVQANRIVNCAGLGAQALASTVPGQSKQFVPPLKMARGNYFQLSGGSPFKRLVYPMPVKGGLGVHATLDMAGTVRFGPDVQPCDVENYVPDETRLTAFREAIATYYPGIADRKLTPDYVGIRPQITLPGEFGDFLISTPQQHGIEGLINMFGIESPGLTSALAIARYVAKQFGYL